MKVKNAVICAAGLGSRLGLDTPKCLVKVGSYRIIDYILSVLNDVPNVRIVVGFKEEEVIKYVKSIRKDVVFVRNPDYMTTTNAYSLYLGSHDLQEPFINIDGDTLISQKQFDKFVNRIEEEKDLIGITKSYTEDAVYVKLNAQQEIVQFSREKVSDFEWTGLAYFAKARVEQNGKYVYQELEKFLPINTVEIEIFEIDTLEDMDYVLNNLDALNGN